MRRDHKRTRIALALAAGVGLVSSAAYGGATATSTFQVKVTIQAQCLAATATTLDFGTQGVFAANVDQISTLQVQCTNTTPYNIGFDKGANGIAVTARKMKGGPTNELLSYSIYSDAGRVTNWGNTVGTDTVSSIGNGAAQSFTAYGRIPVQTTPTPGAYTDTITVTVTY